MYNTWRKNLALIMSLVMILLSLAACEPVDKSVDPIEEAFGYDKSTEFALFDEDIITAEMYLPWLAQYVDYIYYMQVNMGYDDIWWEEIMSDGRGVGDYMKSETLYSVLFFVILDRLAEEYDIALTEEEASAYDDERAASVEELGGEEAYITYLNMMCLTDAEMERISLMGLLTAKVELALRDVPGLLLDEDEDIETLMGDYMAERDIMLAKHILIATIDTETGVALSSDVVAEKTALVEDIASQLEESDDPLALYDELLAIYGEDPGMAYSPNGYLFTSMPDGVDFTSSMVEEFEVATQNLGYNEISGIVESEFGYHIILRLDPLDDAEVYMTYEDKIYRERMDELYQEKMDEITDALAETYDTMELMKVKHIYLDTENFTEKQLSEKMAVAEDILAQIRASADPVATFEELMETYNEDSGAALYPDGYIFAKSPDGVKVGITMEDAFIEVTEALEFNEVSDILVTDKGLHIILRLDPQWTYLNLATTSFFDSIDVEQFYADLSAYRLEQEAYLETLETEDAA